MVVRNIRRGDSQLELEIALLDARGSARRYHRMGRCHGLEEEPAPGPVQHFREQSASYATLEQQQLDFAKQLERLEIEVAVAEPPAAGAHASVWKAHRENVSHARAYIKRVKQQLDSCERYGAVRRYLDRLVRKYEDAANRPWMRVEADSPPP